MYVFEDHIKSNHLFSKLRTVAGVQLIFFQCYLYNIAHAPLVFLVPHLATIFGTYKAQARLKCNHNDENSIDMHHLKSQLSFPLSSTLKPWPQYKSHNAQSQTRRSNNSIDISKNMNFMFCKLKKPQKH